MTERFFDYFQIAGIGAFLFVIVGITLYLRIIKDINPITIVFGKSGIEHFIEFSLFVQITSWAAEVLLYSVPIGFKIFPPPLDMKLIDFLPVKIIGAGFVILAFVVYLLALATFRSSWRMGIDEKKPGKLVTKGIFNFMRNPIFIFFDLYFIGTFLINGNLIFLIFAVLIVATLHCQIIVEEKALPKIYGRAYYDYCARTGRYFTWRF